MSDKIRLPKEVAEELQGRRNEGHTDYRIIADIYDQWNHVDFPDETPMAKFARQYNSPFLRALDNGYEIEEAPITVTFYEDQLRVFRASYKQASDIEKNAIKCAFSYLGIRLKGVND